MIRQFRQDKSTEAIVKEVLDRRPENCQEIDQFGRTPLHELAACTCPVTSTIDHLTQAFAGALQTADLVRLLSSSCAFACVAVHPCCCCCCTSVA